MELEQEAANLGWVPKEQFKGDPERWVDAETFVQRGKEIMPILRKNNETLQGTVDALRNELSQTRDGFEEQIHAMKELQRAAVKDAILRTQKELKEGIKAAREEGNFDDEEELRERLTDVNTQLKAFDAPPPKAPPKQEAPVQIDEATKNWLKDNSWYDSDEELRGIAYGLAVAIRNNPATSNLKEKAFYDKLDERMAKYLPTRRGSPSKVASPTPGGGGGDGGEGKAFADLPSEAKAQAKADASRFVGEGKSFKTNAEWEAHFANLYWGS